MDGKNVGHIAAIANGLGSQSMYLCVLAAKGKIPFNVSISADTGAEDDCLWNTGERTSAREYFEQVTKPYCATHGIDARFVRARNKYGAELPGLVDYLKAKIAAGTSASIPLYGSRNGRLRQGCTQKWKIVAIHQEARRMGAKTLRTAQGIHIGEATRRVKGRYLSDEGNLSIYQETIKTKDGQKDVKWCTHCYPLVDLKMHREDTRAGLRAEGLPYLESSECDHCPHKDLDRWERTAPAKLIEIASIEESMKGEYFFTPERIPLMQAIEKMKARKEARKEKKIEADFGCGNAYCGI